jgi:hypothetical protein
MLGTRRFPIQSCRNLVEALNGAPCINVREPAQKSSIRNRKLGGWKSYEMVLRYAHLAPEKLSSVAGRIERQPLAIVDGAQRSANVAKNATFSELRRQRSCASS